jgi:hypothetical protein
MPFELGLTLGLHHRARHNWMVLDHTPYVLKKVLSDLDGYDVVHIHGRSPNKLLACLNDAFHRPGVGLGDLKRVRRQLQKYATENLSGQLFTRHGFGSLTVAATAFARSSRRGGR